jgi:uncharacterized protein (DUF924 family)
MTTPRAILEFWFSPQARPLWFEQDKAFDAAIQARFGAAIHAAQQGALDSWQQSPEATLALLLLLDQFSRNVYRGQAKAFLGDTQARAIADCAIAKGFDRQFDYDRRRFFYLPFEHGESLADQQRAIMLFERALDEVPPQERDCAAEQLDYAHRHRIIIERFGRFPHRNEALGRPSTEAEIAFLREPGSSF